MVRIHSRHTRIGDRDIELSGYSLDLSSYRRAVLCRARDELDDTNAIRVLRCEGVELLCFGYITHTGEYEGI